MKYFLLIILLPIFLISAKSQNSTTLGVATGVNFISNETNYNIIPGDTCCGEFNNGSDYGFYFGLNFEHEFLTDFLFLQGRAIFDSRPVTLNSTTNDYSVYVPQNNRYEKVDINNNFNATLNYFTFGVNFLIQPFRSLPIRFGIGYEISDASITNEYEQTRRIVEPSGLMINGVNEEIVNSGNMDDLTTSQGLSLGVSAKIELDKRISVNPEFIYRHPINSLVESSDWTSRVFRAGASIMISLNSIEDEPIDIIEGKKPIIEEDTENIVSNEEPEIDTDTNKEFIKSLSISDVIVTETVVTQTYPILPYLFFDELESELDNKYKLTGTTANFDIQDLDKNSLSIYYRILDIVAYRINKYNSPITITGFTDGIEVKDSVSQIKLAQNRATSVSNYLQEKWGIDSKLINIDYNRLPDSPTSSEYKEGLAENRRVKISSSDSRVLEPIIHSEFEEYKVNNENLVFNVEYEHLEAIEDVNLTISDGNNTYYNETYFSDFENKLIIELDKELIKKLANSDKNSLKAEIMVTTQNGIIESKYTNLAVDLNQSNFELGRLNLIVFDFDKSEISKENKTMIDQFIVENIKDNSTLNVVGSTDYLGEKQYNKNLSSERATNVAEYIKQLVPDAKFKQIVGIGSENPKFDNSKPEGRFYCRTVFVEVKTPIID